MRSINCDVRAISGTKRSTSPPSARVSAMRVMYISVLPEPVIPRSRCTALPSRHEARISSAARCCAGVRRGGSKTAFDERSTLRSRSATVMYPALRRAASREPSNGSRRRGASPSAVRTAGSNAAIASKASQRRGARRRMRSHSARNASRSRHGAAKAM